MMSCPSFLTSKALQSGALQTPKPMCTLSPYNSLCWLLAHHMQPNPWGSDNICKGEEGSAPADVKRLRESTTCCKSARDMPASKAWMGTALQVCRDRGQLRYTAPMSCLSGGSSLVRCDYWRAAALYLQLPRRCYLPSDFSLTK